MDKYTFRPYNPNFPKLFATEKARLERYLGTNIQIEHVGSTSVPGLGGKGIIDIAIAVNEKDVAKTPDKLTLAGYEFKPNASTKDRLFFKRAPQNLSLNENIYHIHLILKGSKGLKEILAFRDYLRSHTDAREKYAEIKKHAANIANQDKDIYMKTKEPIIQEIIQQALNEYGTKRKVPLIIEKVGFDFHWDEKKVWGLDVPVEEMNISKLEWHFDIPFWHTLGGYYDLTPNQVLSDPEKYKEEFDRTMKADLSYPLDIMWWKNWWLLLDGLHRLVKAKQLGWEKIKVRKIPKKAIPQISK